MKLHGLRRKHIPRICLSTSLYFVVIFALLVLSIIKLYGNKNDYTCKSLVKLNSKWFRG